MSSDNINKLQSTVYILMETFKDYHKEFIDNNNVSKAKILETKLEEAILVSQEDYYNDGLQEKLKSLLLDMILYREAKALVK